MSALSLASFCQSRAVIALLLLLVSLHLSLILSTAETLSEDEDEMGGKHRQRRGSGGYTPSPGSPFSALIPSMWPQDILAKLAQVSWKPPKSACIHVTITVRAPVFGRHQFFGTSEHYGKAHGSLLSGWMNYNYTACCWFPTSSNILMLPSQFLQIRFESCWILHCSKCRILVLLRYPF